MKKLLLFLSVACAGILQADAQSFTVQAGDTSTAVYTGNSDLTIYNRVRSTSATPVKIVWRVVSANVPTGWSLTGICDNIICQPASVINNTTTTYTTDPYDSSYAGNDFHVAYFDMGSAPRGTAVIRVEMKEESGANPRTVTFIGTKSPQGVSAIRTEDAVVVYPNPASDAVNVLFDEKAGVKNIAIYNLIGQPVSVFHVAGNSANLPLGNAPAGVYFVRLLDGQNHILATRRFTKQ